MSKEISSLLESYMMLGTSTQHKENADISKAFMDIINGEEVAEEADLSEEVDRKSAAAISKRLDIVQRNSEPGMVNPVLFLSDFYEAVAKSNKSGAMTALKNLIEHAKKMAKEK